MILGLLPFQLPVRGADEAPPIAMASRCPPGSCLRPLTFPSHLCPGSRPLRAPPEPSCWTPLLPGCMASCTTLLTLDFPPFIQAEDQPWWLRPRAAHGIPVTTLAANCQSAHPSWLCQLSAFQKLLSICPNLCSETSGLLRDPVAPDLGTGCFFS